MNRDKTGPNGQGPRTGRGLGDCVMNECAVEEDNKSILELQLDNLKTVNTEVNNCISLYIKEGNNHNELVKQIDDEISTVKLLEAGNSNELLNELMSIKDALGVVDTGNIKNGIVLFANDNELIAVCTHPTAITNSLYIVDNIFYLQPLLDMLK